MERILNEFKFLNKSGTSSGSFEEISLITYLANLDEDEIIITEIETASNILHCAFRNLYDDGHYNIFQDILVNEKSFLLLTEKSSQSSYKIQIRNTWLFQLILVNSLKHAEFLNNTSNTSNTSLIITVIKYVLKNNVITKPLSIYFLKILLLIVSKRKDVLSSELNLKILNLLNKVALSPITVFKQHARAISKSIIPFQPKDALLDLVRLPIRGIELSDVLEDVPLSYITANKHNIVKKIVRMFQKNVESKDGGILYQVFTKHEFSIWKIEIWPLFLVHLQNIDYEGEFFQSLLKYWITSNVATYKDDFYYFMRSEPIDWTLKGHILLQTKRNGCNIDEKIAQGDILTIFNNIKTRTLGLKLATIYHKKSSWLQTYEIDIVMSYLYSNTNTSLQEEETTTISLFISQIFVCGHNELSKTDKNISNYTSVINRIYKYCLASLKTDFFEVGAELIYIIWRIATGCHKNLILSYRLDKRDAYSQGENLLYKKLKDVWWFKCETCREALVKCFSENKGSSTYLTKIFCEYLDVSNFSCTINLKDLTEEMSLHSTLDGEKIIKNYAEVVYGSQNCAKENMEFLGTINDYIINIDKSSESYYEEVVFKIVLYLEIVTAATKYYKFDTERLKILIEKALSIVTFIIKSISTSGDQKYKRPKVVEAFINKVMLCMRENISSIWETMDKEKVIEHLIVIIQRSNMKRPLSLSVEVLKRIGYEMNKNESDKNYKIQFLNQTMNSLCQTATKSDLKIRRNPESRLVIHAICSSDVHPNKPIIKWVLTYLTEFISDPNASDASLASALHTIEILVSDNNLQNPTLPFISDIIVQCVELFGRSSWIVRNADLQLTRAIIDRFYGVCLDVCDRPKCVEDLFVFFPTLVPYFHNILSSDTLDDRAVLIFQFFSVSQITENKIMVESCEGSIRLFQQLLMDILQNYSNYYGKMAARSFSALCPTRTIPEEICSILRYLKVNFHSLRKNIFVNFMFLLEQLYEKYKNSYHCNINEDRIKIVNFAIMDFVRELRKSDMQQFSLVLFKIKSLNTVLREFTDNLDYTDYQKRLWLHNNVPFLLINSKPENIKNVLHTILSEKLSSCIQIKILSIIISRFENNDFHGGVLRDILEILFEKSITVNDTDDYLLNCYFKTVFVLYRSSHASFLKNKLLSFERANNIYKLMIFVLYYFERTAEIHVSALHNFYKTVESKYMEFLSFNEETRNDILSTLPYLYKEAPQMLQLKIFRIIFYSCLFISTYKEAYNCINVISGCSYSSILSALNDFLSVKNVMVRLKGDTRLVKEFFASIVKYVPEHVQQVGSVGYYSEESDILVPKAFLNKLVVRAASYIDQIL